MSCDLTEGVRRVDEGNLCSFKKNVVTNVKAPFPDPMPNPIRIRDQHGTHVDFELHNIWSSLSSYPDCEIFRSVINFLVVEFHEFDEIFGESSTCQKKNSVGCDSILSFTAPCKNGYADVTIWLYDFSMFKQSNNQMLDPQSCSDSSEIPGESKFWCSFKYQLACDECGTFPRCDSDDIGGDVAIAWNRIALDANIEDHRGAEKPGNELTESMGPPASAVVLAKVHMSMYDAYNSITKEFEKGFYMVEDSHMTVGASIDAAVATAACQVLIHSYPGQIDNLLFLLHQYMSAIPDGEAKDKGIKIGLLVSSAMTMDRVSDGMAPGDIANAQYTWKNSPGEHMADPNHPNQAVISPQGGDITTFLIPEPILVPPPPAITTSKYAEAFNEVKRRGGDNITTATDRSLNETVVAWYWSYDGSPGLSTPPRLCNEIARLVACKKGNTLKQNIRLFALVNGALADAGISSWKAKFIYNYWRPVNGIRNADKDNNADTLKDDNWNYLGAARSNPVATGETNFSPAFPAYTSGHATFCASFFKILANFYGTNNMTLRFMSQEWDGHTLDDMFLVRPCLVQVFKKLSFMASQCAASRVFNGVHWGYDGTEGIRAGNAIADNIFEKRLREIQDDGQPKPEVSIPDVNIDQEVQDILDRKDDSKPHLETCQKGGIVEEVVWNYIQRRKDPTVTLT